MSEYEGTLAAVRHCLRIRNQYAHCHWAHDETGIFFANLEEAANRAYGFNYDWKQVDLTILNEQEAFFDNMKDRLIYLGDTLANALQKTSPRVPRPRSIRTEFQKPCISSSLMPSSGASPTIGPE